MSTSPFSALLEGDTAPDPSQPVAEVPDLLRVLGYKALQPGPRLLVIGGVHGDETCGTLAIERLRLELDAGWQVLRSGQLTMVPVANPLARRRGQREGERNLNRNFRPTLPGQSPADYEARIVDVLCPIIEQHDALLDLHSFESAGEAFAMIGPRNNTGTLEPFSRAEEEGRLAAQLGTARVVEGWLDIYADGLAQRAAAGEVLATDAIDFGRGTNEYMRSRGGYGVTLECGQHRDPAAPEVGYRAILATLRHLGMIDAEAGAETPPAPQVLRLAGVVLRLSAGDRFEREWATFDSVQAGQVIGHRADGEVLKAQRDGFIVFPNDKALAGAEWFYFAHLSDRRLD
ncbi:succinylglutamate desuccinylase/aspartoacylase family protein [Variovorax dokdonensis]|uniref:Succinylglutamate desuccinylase/aspartoacylase family protein n=1 Tax=Variovorax dokdonensis TaxID=344883 RepID=A0ABT7NAD2_9BURK|nr:succinylglutamate desuccinylase/aspartoacylase family protein [Variovorax dokdonensis]MDM0044906.1 succinylglutamate desuccinylase/aspartoacylase family protein [Variovorax dokdonensis]